MGKRTPLGRSLKVIEADPRHYLTILGVGIAAYLWLVLVLRISGKRTLAKLNAFDLVVTVAFGSLLATVIVSRDVDWLTGAIAFALLTLLQFIVASVSLHWHWFRDLVRSRPTLIVSNGRFLDNAMASERLTRGEVEAAIRKQGIGSVSNVAAVVFETDGSFSVIGNDKGPLELTEDVRGAERREG